MRTSPFPPYDPETANLVYRRNFHITVLLIFISLLYGMAAIGCVIKLATGGTTATEMVIWTTSINLTLFLVTIPNYLLIALKCDYLRSRWAPLKALPLVFTALTGLVVSGVQGAKWRIDWMEAVLLVVLPVLIYILGVVLGKTIVGKFFAPFRIETKRIDLELAIPVAPPLPTPPLHLQIDKKSPNIQQQQAPGMKKTKTRGRIDEDVAIAVEIQSN